MNVGIIAANILLTLVLCRFSPDVLGVEASSAVVWLVLEVCCVLAALHLNAGAVVKRPLHALHVLSLAGYKYPG